MLRPRVFRVPYTEIDQIRNVLRHWFDTTLLMLDPDVKRCTLDDLTSFQGAPCPEQRQEHFTWWMAILMMRARKLLDLLGVEKASLKMKLSATGSSKQPVVFVGDGSR